MGRKGKPAVHWTMVSLIRLRKQKSPIPVVEARNGLAFTDWSPAGRCSCAGGPRDPL
jgi:hypothetical protein